jgi:uncharacterized protein (DUF58 family)
MSFIDGVSVSVSELFLQGQKSRGFDLHFKNMRSKVISGDKRSKIRGRGMDFFESRPYVEQDEIKNIDWKVSAKLNKLYTKIYTEEKNRPIYLVIDLRCSMFFGSTICFKSVLASSIAARIAMAALNGGDHVGGIVFDGHAEHHCKSSSSQKNLARLFGFIAKATTMCPPVGKPPWTSVLTELTKKPSGSMIFLISDFLNLDDSHRPLLFRLKKRSDIMAIKITDPLEKKLPALGEVAMAYGDERVYFDSSNTSLKKRYEFLKHEIDQKLKHIFLITGIPMIEFSTSQDPSLNLKKIFSGRW